MQHFFSTHNVAYKFCAAVLTVLHILTFGPMREAFAFSAQSANYRLNAGTLSSGSGNRTAAAAKVSLDSIGESCVGKSQSANYILQAGFVPLVQSTPPHLSANIPYQKWALNTSKANAFDLDDYFSSPEGYALTYSVMGNSSIGVNIAADTHAVSFSPPQGWSGVEKVYFSATDTEFNTTKSNRVVLQVEDLNGPDKPVIVGIQVSPYIIQEGDLVTMIVQAVDADGEEVNFAYNNFFAETRKWKEGDFWYSEAAWQTTTSNKGHYNITVSVTDPGGLTDAESVLVNVGNLNHPPVLDSIPDINVNETQLATISPHAVDEDNDPISYYYESPFDSTGKWLTNYNDAGTYYITVIASDGIDTVSQEAKVVVFNTNRAPTAVLTLSSYTLEPNKSTTITLSASDPDSDPMMFTLLKDAQEIASGSVTGTYSTTTSFSSEGYYKITAKVRDSGGLETTIVKDVHVTTNKASQPVMGDFNGDCLTDLGLHDADTGRWEVSLSQAGVFESVSSWMPSFGTGRDWQPTGGDFNGDGKTDIGIYNASIGRLEVGISTGTGFTDAGPWLTASFASVAWQSFTGNFNGDKYTDFALYNRDSGEVRVFLSTGSGFSAYTVWGQSLGTGYTAMSGDFNGDSLADLCLFNKTSGEFKVYFSNTGAFVDGSVWKTGFATDKDAFTADFNNDGLTDVGYWDKSTNKWYYCISTGNTFVDKGEWITLGGSNDDSATTGDFNGDGVTDAAIFDAEGLGINRWRVQLSTNKPADLLTEIDNGIGGKTVVAYTYAAKSDNDALPFPVYVASSISLVNTVRIQETYTQNFNFSGGYYDATEREFRGFAKVRVTDPVTGNYSETYYYQGKPGQDGALKGQIEKVISYDGNARPVSQVINTYEVRKSGPQDGVLGFPYVKESSTTVWEENAINITTANTFTYDGIGNLIEEISGGDAAQTGDEKISAVAYSRAYEGGFNRPLETALKDKDGNVVTKKNFEYDTRGNLTREKVLIFNPLTIDHGLSTIDYVYDSFGNVTSTIDALGRAVTTEYETGFYAFPKKVTNALGHSVQYMYDPKFGAVTSVTDTNGQTSVTELDTFGRTVVVRNADNQVVTSYSYPDFNTKITTQLNLRSIEYVDGLGRKYKTVSAGEDGASARDVVSEVFFNNRGLTEKESLPHYAGEYEANITYVKYEYDIRGRIKKTISDFPGELKDAFSTIDYKEPLYVEAIDPLGHKKGTRKDVYGNVREVIEFTTDGVFHTYYEYDIQNNLIKLTDNQGNITRMTYDSAGRKLKMIDPDMGTWLYEYDVLGNLLRQTDAKGQALEFEYDSLNRLKRKFAQGADLVNYYYDDPLISNRIGRLYKIVDQSGSTEFFYDTQGREVKSVKTVDGVAYTVERAYDLLSRLTSLKYPDGEVVNYTYDANSGQLERVAGAGVYVQDITYNAKSQIKVIQYGNNTQTNYTYGQDLRLSQILTQNASAVTLQSLTYDFDKNGNLTTLVDNLRSNIRTYAYDSLDRLTEARNLPAPGAGNNNYTDYFYQYDSIGNMTYKSDLGVMTYGQNAGPHALTSAGGYAYQYDANGNMTAGKNKVMEYDVENRLKRVDELGVVTSFVYDGDGGRVKKSTIDGSQTNETVYIGSLYEVESNGKITKHIFAGANRTCTITKEGTVTEVNCIHSDHLGSSNIITDQSGQQVQHCEYTPYGTVAHNEGTDVARHKFTGKELDRTGLYYYGARYYDPEIGRFITADTIVQDPYDPQSLNRYSYCRNNPIKYIDPSGHAFWLAIIAIVKAVAAYAAAHPVIFGAIVCATLNTAMNASNIHNFGNFMMYAGIGAISGIAGGYTAGLIGGFWGSMAGSFVGGFVGGTGNSLYSGAGFGQALAFGFVSGAFAAATSAVIYGGVKIAGKAIESAQNASRARAVASGVKTPIGQQGQGSAASSLNTNKGKSAIRSQALSLRSSDSEAEVIHVIKPRAEMQPIKTGDKVYRVWGDGAGPDGRSWTNINPESVPNFRAEAGLPPQNTGRFVTEGRLKDTTGVVTKPAESLYGNPGGLQEVFIPDPKNQVQIERVSGVNPEY